MSIELTRDANKLLEDIELELASIKAATALRSLDRPAPPASRATAAVEHVAPAARVIGNVDLSQARSEADPASTPALVVPAPTPVASQPELPKRRTLQERLASLNEEG